MSLSGPAGPPLFAIQQLQITIVEQQDRGHVRWIEFGGSHALHGMRVGLAPGGESRLPALDEVEPRAYQMQAPARQLNPAPQRIDNRRLVERPGREVDIDQRDVAA